MDREDGAEETPRHADITFTTMGRTEGQPDNSMPSAETAAGTEAQILVNRLLVILSPSISSLKRGSLSMQTASNSHSPTVRLYPQKSVLMGCCFEVHVAGRRLMDSNMKRPKSPDSLDSSPPLKSQEVQEEEEEEEEEEEKKVGAGYRAKRERRHSISSATMCQVCNIQLNSSAQAQIHYRGKTHQRRLRRLAKAVSTGYRR